MSDTIDLAELRTSIRDVLARETDSARIHTHVNRIAAEVKGGMTAGCLHDRGLAATVASLGWPGLAVAQADGGLGLGLEALAVLHEELGRRTAPIPLLSTLLVADVLGRAPEAVRDRWLPGLVSGEVFAAYAPTTRLAGEHLTGEVGHILNGESADVFLLGLKGGRLALVARDAPGVTVTPVATVDHTRGLAHLVLRDVAVHLLPVHQAVADRHAALALACDSLGGAAAVLEKTIDYLKVRTQFDQPIGRFQALKHRVADHKLRLEVARALVAQALSADGDEDQALGLAQLARASANAAYVAVADDAVQLHGGIGFTWELDIHLYLKRARLNRVLFGGDDVALDLAAAALVSVPPAATTTLAVTPRPLDHVADPEAFRAAVRSWLASVVPDDWKQRLTGASEEGYVAFQQWWFGELKKAGLATPHWPKSWGGEELPLSHAVILNEELARADAPRPDVFTVSLFHLPATLFAYGTPAQQERYLTGVRDRGEVWCQGFSEPGAGSDLASLRTRAEKRTLADGRVVYIVSGQKVWSSYAMHARYCLLLARTDPQAPKKQAGISYFIMDMASPGVIRRPIRQINGGAEFCELFLDEVEIPAENLIGAEGDGWRIAQATLSAERGLIIVDLAERLRFAMEGVLLTAGAGEVGWWSDAAHRRTFMDHYGRLLAVRRIIREMMAEVAADPHMGTSPLPMYVKLLYSELLHEHAAFLVDRAGVAEQVVRPRPTGDGNQAIGPYDSYLWSYAWTIAGGTNEVLKNIVAERVLGLPR
ncbi:acyl-CoA dehydrogenase family protein [Nitrospirillum sp. BR 11164]|uniref:acyl-CoA dehydrogenase n=1 Tax=Nitrospirillum sp. BR 11164 TaxID=3104324 RepID=UPI002AFE11CF|nr:acyl-CoA dehydrogenase family protein [Nitrospirillum sp. BR 11164]MEA1652876.1 acyl-CoA dehydrogenase family protein [Nitrospirillum sp. BR 11164]